MTARIGRTFRNELIAAGLGDIRLTWTPETGVIEFNEEVTEQQRAAVLAVLAAHDPVASNRAVVWEKIKQERDRRCAQGGYAVNGKWFHSDGKARDQQLGLVLLGAGIPPGVQWKTMDGSLVEMTQTLAQQILGAAAASDIAVHAAAEAHKAAMEQAADPLAYDFSGGWPAVYGE